MIPLQSYGNPSPEAKFADLDYFDFQLKEVSYLILDQIVFLELTVIFSYSMLYQQMILLIIAKCTKYPHILLKEDMPLQYASSFSIDTILFMFFSIK